MQTETETETQTDANIPKQKRRTPAEKFRDNPKSLRCGINAMCYECSGEDKKEITLCTAVGCPLYNLRPYQKKEKK